ncbi:MAG TPA: HupE/UreJ family protein [Polyangiales bacterium]|nr:HupE/UreJ family protein [Polyangiales bacterium]
MSRSPKILTITCFALLSSAGLAHAHAVQLEANAPPLVEYFRLGVEHILTGFDHLVFLLGVVLIATRTRSVLAAVTAFTLAHSLTLALSVLGFVSVSPRLVEPLIALSVAYVGLENFWARDASRRYRITFAFGLVHGFGFAGALAEIGLPPDRVAGALACFNLGVEAGQLVVLAALWPLLLWFHNSHVRPFMKLAAVVNVAIVVLGTTWAVERSLGGEAAVATDLASTENEMRAATNNLPPPAADKPHRDTEPSVAPSDIRSVYASVATSPLAERICHIMQRFPRERRAECGGESVGVTLDGECTRMLSAALASGALKAEAGLDGRCVSALESRYETCEFMQYPSLSPVAACTDLWLGQLAAGAVCRSSLECKTGLSCHGISPTQTGVCGAAKPKGASCGTAIDALASYLPHNEADHPECTGSCTQGRCQ